MMCNAHLVRGTTFINENDLSQEICIRDDRAEVYPEGDETVVDGFVLSITLGIDAEAPSVSFDIEEARAFIEACQEILDRYDE